MNDTINLFASDTTQAAALKTLLASAWERPDLLDGIDWNLPHRIDIAGIESLLSLNIPVLDPLLRETEAYGKLETNASLRPAHHLPMSDAPITPGDTPLHIAARLGPTTTVLKLLGAAPRMTKAKNAFFQTAADVAKTPQLRHLIAGSATMDACDCELFYRALNSTPKAEAIPTDGSVVREIQVTQIEFDKKHGACHAT